MPQTAVNVQQGTGFAGLLADSSDLEDAISYTNTEASTELAFGTAVKQGTNAFECKQPAAQADLIVGIVLHSHAYQKNNELGTTGLKPGVTLSALTRGRVWVPVTEAVAITDTPRIFMSGANAGQFCKTASGGVTKAIGTSARFITATSGSGVAMLEFDVNNRSGWTND